MEAERFLLKWNNHQSNLVTVFDQLYEQEAFTDVTLACDGKSFAAHKVILSACSPYFQSLFLANPNTHPIVFMRDVRGSDLESLLAFMYRGEINVHQQDLASFLKTAESLQIKGLSDCSERQRDTSKILEAMEKKFNTTPNHNNNTNSNNNNSHSTNHSSNNSYNNHTSPSSNCSSAAPSPTSNSTNNGIGSCASAFAGIRNLPPRVSSALSTLSSLHLGSSINGGLVGAYGNLGAGLPVLAAAAAGNGYPENLSTNSKSESHSPPAKRHRSFEDLPRILPKVRSALTSPPSLMSNIPGLLTPITLAAAAVNSVATQPQVPILANTPTSVHASPPTPETSSSSPAADAATPTKEKIKKEHELQARYRDQWPAWGWLEGTSLGRGSSHTLT
ncbi:BTB/POZ domain [Trinorchestia longiramus]|nr:BTB/POZ domain [Trinorchestia longiramus]